MPKFLSVIGKLAEKKRQAPARTVKPSSLSPALADLENYCMENEDKSWHELMGTVRHKRRRVIQDSPARAISQHATSECAICLYPCATPYGIPAPCDHRYCFACLEDWSNVANACPLCKRVFTTVCKIYENGRTEVVQVKAKSISFSDAESDEEEPTVCEVCGESDDEHCLLLCDGCNLGFHTWCVDLENVPDGDWYCDACERQLKG